MRDGDAIVAVQLSAAIVAGGAPRAMGEVVTLDPDEARYLVARRQAVVVGADAVPAAASPAVATVDRRAASRRTR